MQQVLVISVKAKEVFKYLKLASRYRGNLTLKELLKEQKKSSEVR